MSGQGGRTAQKPTGTAVSVCIERRSGSRPQEARFVAVVLHSDGKISGLFQQNFDAAITTASLF